MHYKPFGLCSALTNEDQLHAPGNEVWAADWAF